MKPLEKTDKEKEELDEFERCVLCNSVTPYKRGDYIDLRNCYIEGGGQFCEACFVKTYGCN
jgi:hypothetical protein